MATFIDEVSVSVRLQIWIGVLQKYRVDWDILDKLHHIEKYREI